MLLLSSILGPAKPPVASREEVASAPGVFRITPSIPTTSTATSSDNLMLNQAHPWIATATAASSPTSTNDADEHQPRMQLIIEAGDRCLICLCEYQMLEELRQLNQCRHVYHRECIDEVSHFGTPPASHPLLLAPFLWVAWMSTSVMVGILILMIK